MYEHVQRMQEDRLPKEVMTCYPIGRNKRKGIPESTWIGGIRRTVGKTGLAEEEWRDRENL